MDGFAAQQHYGKTTTCITLPPECFPKTPPEIEPLDYKHSLQATNITTASISAIRNMDSFIGTYVKDILHLPSNTPNGVIYCCKRDGSLSVVKVLSINTALKHGIEIFNSVDQTLQELLRAMNYEHRLVRMAKSVRLP